ncbi:MAG: hypothetical protein F6J87_16410 [Spirulina sp. SIO3F2]|nr:hypothetical protein [Spirulina sp. SIO3F2]
MKLQIFSKVSHWLGLGLLSALLLGLSGRSLFLLSQKSSGSNWIVLELIFIGLTGLSWLKLLSIAERPRYIAFNDLKYFKNTQPSSIQRSLWITSVSMAIAILLQIWHIIHEPQQQLIQQFAAYPNLESSSAHIIVFGSIAIAWLLFVRLVRVLLWHLLLWTIVSKYQQVILPILHCQDCGNPLRQLRNKELPPFLSTPQKIAQKLGTTRYYGWQCPHCATGEHSHAIHLQKRKSDEDLYFAECPDCQEWTVKKSVFVSQHPTHTSEGENVVVKECQCCDFRALQRYTTPRLLWDDSVTEKSNPREGYTGYSLGTPGAGGCFGGGGGCSGGGCGGG